MRKLLISLTFVCFQCLFLLAANQNNLSENGINKPDWPIEVLSWDIDKAYPGIEYNYRLGVRGGEYPYTFSLEQAPEGMTIDENSGEIKWTPEGESENNQVIISITDKKGASITHSFTVSADKDAFRFVAANGKNTNDGSEASPWATIQYASENAGKSNYVYIKEGTYNVVMSINGTKCGRFLAWPGDQVTIVGTGTGKSSISINGGEKIIFQGFTFDANDHRWLFSCDAGLLQNIIWRKNTMHNAFSDDMENPAFIFFWDGSKKPVNGQVHYKNMVIQENKFHDLRNKNNHGASVTMYDVQDLLYEDNTAFDIDGRGVSDKDDGYRNTIRNNILYECEIGIGMFNQSTQAYIEVCYNLIYNCSNTGIVIGGQPGYFKDLFIHHNNIVGSIHFSGIVNSNESSNFNIYNNIIGNGDVKPYSISPMRVDDANGSYHYEYPNWFQTSDPKVQVADNLVWGKSNSIAGYGWGIPATSWDDWKKRSYDVNGTLANPGLDANYALPTTSPYYGIYGRDLNNSNTNADVTAPTTPKTLAGTAASQTAINLTWTASTDAVGVTGYRIYRNGTQIGTSATTSFSDKNLTASTQYAYRIAAYDAAGNVSAQCTEVNVTTLAEVKTSISENDRKQGYHLSQNTPNPFKHFTQIEFELEKAGFVTLKIFDINGREIASLVNNTMPAGKHTVQWNGTNAAGQEVGKGVYFYQLKTNGGFVETKKMLMIIK